MSEGIAFHMREHTDFDNNPVGDIHKFAPSKHFFDGSNRTSLQEKKSVIPAREDLPPPNMISTSTYIPRQDSEIEVESRSAAGSDIRLTQRINNIFEKSNMSESQPVGHIDQFDDSLEKFV